MKWKIVINKGLIAKLFGLIMVIGGVIDLLRPEQLKLAMDSLFMPHYMLTILGVAKIVGGMVLIFIPKYHENAYTGFFIWALGGIAAHIFSGHGIGQTLPIIGLTVFLFAAFIFRSKGR